MSDFPRVTASISSRAEARACISELDAQISDLKLSLSALRFRRKAVQKRWLDSYTYPVLKLPNEIVAEIFTQFLPPYPERPPMVGLLSPSTLGQVCRKWREIAISTPLLWRAIALKRARSPSTQLRLLEMWLNRSRVCPLVISLAFHMKEDTVILPIITTLLAYAGRWEEVEVFLPSSYMEHFSSRNMPLLRTLTMGTTMNPDPNLVVLFEQAPNLTHVRLYEVFSPFKTLLPWSQVTTLDALWLYENELGKILRLAGNLVHCTTRLVGSTNGGGLPAVALHMHLQDLILTDGTSHKPVPKPMLDKLTLPALRRLQVPERWFSPNPATAIASWLSRSGCKLEQLHIVDSQLSESYYRHALSSVSRISVVG